MPHFDARWQRPEILQAIFDQISDAIFFFDKNLHLVRVNKGGEKLFTLPAEAMIGKHCGELFGGAASESGEDIPPGAGKSWCIPTGTVWLRMDQGRNRKVIIRTMELLDEAGALEGVVATAADIPDGIHPDAVDMLGESRAGETITFGPARTARDKHLQLVLRNRRVLVAAGIGFLLCLVVVGAAMYLGPGMGKQLTPQEKQSALAEKQKREASVMFNGMTSAQHIQQAKLALRQGATANVISEGMRHLKAIPPSAPESAGVAALQQSLTKARSLANAQSLIYASSSGDLREGMDKVQRAIVIIEGVTQQYPNDQDADQVSRAAQAATEQLAMRFPHEFASAETKLVDFTWQKGGFGTVMIANFTIRNDSPVDVADIKIHCEHYGASGVVLDQNAGIAFAVVKARSTTRIANVNMGFLNAQPANARVTKTDCEIVTLRLASESQALGSPR